MTNQTTQSADRKVWAYVAHKGDKLAGIIAGSCGVPGMPAVTPEQERDWRKEIAAFCSEFVLAGFDIAGVYSEEEYRALVDPMTSPADDGALP